MPLPGKMDGITFYLFYTLTVRVKIYKTSSMIFKKPTGKLRLWMNSYMSTVACRSSKSVCLSIATNVTLLREVSDITLEFPT